MHGLQIAAASPPPRHRQVTGLWILLAGTVATALIIFAGSHMALCGARRVASTKAYQGSVSRLQMAGKRVGGSLPRKLSSLGSGISRLGSGLSRRAGDAGSGPSRSDSDKNSAAGDGGAEAELGAVLAGVHALSATAAGLEAQLRQLTAAHAAAAEQSQGTGAA